MQRQINPDNFNQVLVEIRGSKDSLFDFSGTNFQELGHSRLSDLFYALSCCLSEGFVLKLHNCKIDEENPKHIEALTLGFSTTHKMEALEFVRSISPTCREEILENILMQIAQSLARNHAVKSIKVDGFRVTPPSVCEELKNHPKALLVLVDGLLKLKREEPAPMLKQEPVSSMGLFKEPSNVSKDVPPTDRVQKPRNRSGG